MDIYIGIEDNAFGRGRKAACAYVFQEGHFLFTVGSAYRTLAYWVKSGICQTGHHIFFSEDGTPNATLQRRIQDKDALKLIGSEVPQEIIEKITWKALGKYCPANEDEMETLSKDFELTLDELDPWHDDRISL